MARNRNHHSMDRSTGARAAGVGTHYPSSADAAVATTSSASPAATSFT